MKTSLRMAALCGGALLTTATVHAQSVVRLVTQGDQINGNGKVTIIDNIAVNDFGGWMAECRTDLSDTSMNKVLLKDGQVLLTKGQTLPGMGGATLSKFDSMTIDNNGNCALNLELANAPVGADEAIFWNNQLLVQSGAPVTAAGITTGTIFTGFLEVRLNNNNQVAVLADIDDPQMVATPERALIILNTDGAGNILSQDLIDVVGGTFPPVTGFPIVDYANAAHFWGFNDNGSAIYGVKMDTASGGDNEGVSLDGASIAEEGTPSPIAGRNWTNFGTPEMSLNNAGDWVLALGLDGSATDDQVIFHNGVKFMQEGDAVLSAGGHALTNFGTGPVEIGHNGDILWCAKWNDPNPLIDRGLIVNQNLIIQEGVTMSGTNVIKTLTALIDGYHLSPGGNVIIFEGQLDNGDNAVMSYTLGAPSGGPGSVSCSGDGTTGPCPCGNNGAPGEGCAHSSGVGASLNGSGTASIGAADLTFVASQLPPNRISMLVTSNASGTSLFGHGLLCVGTSWTSLQARVASGTGGASWNTASLTNGTYVAGVTSQFQILFRDPTGPCGSAFGTSSAYQVPFVQ